MGLPLYIVMSLPFPTADFYFVVILLLYRLKTYTYFSNAVRVVSKKYIILYNNNKLNIEIYIKSIIINNQKLIIKIKMEIINV